MRRPLLSSAAALAMALAAPALSATLAEQVVAGLQAQGFATFVLTAAPTQVRVVAHRGNTRVTLVHDAATGALLEEEIEQMVGDDDLLPPIAPGVTVATSPEGFWLDDGKPCLGPADDRDDGDEGDEEEDAGRRRRIVGRERGSRGPRGWAAGA